MLLAKRQEDNCIVRYMEGLKNKIREHLVNLCELNDLETQVIFFRVKLDRALPFFI